VKHSMTSSSVNECERVTYNRVRVVFVGQSGTEAGGAERSMQLLLAHLPERFEAGVVLFEEGAYAQELRERGFHVEIVALQRELMAIQRERLPPAAALGTLGMLPRLAAAYRRLRADIVYTNTVKAHVLGAPAARLAGVRCIMHLRDILDGRARDVLRIVGRTCTVQRVAISRAVAASLALPKTAVVPNPIELAAYDDLPTRADARRQLRLPPEVPLIGILGRINRWKGHDRFLRIATLVAARSDAHFAIVGKPMFRDADFADELHALVTDYDLTERVHFVPWLDDPRPAYAALDVNANTSRAEPFGRTIIEAAACGVPTVCFDEGGAPDAVGGSACGRVVPSGDEQAFAAAVLALLAGDRAATAAACRMHAQNFDATLHAERIGAILDRVAKGARHG